MILIDFVYINSPGGLSLSKLLLDYIIERKIKSKIEVLVDKRNYKYFKNYKINLILISKSEFSRFNFYKKNKKRFESLLCFANVPPPLKIQVKTLIYFHNEILLNSNNLNFSLIKKIFFKLKWLYIKSQNSNYTWIVQTNHMKDLLGDKLKVNSNNILKYPIFKNQKIYTESKQNNTYIYPTSNEPHKNNHRVLNAFISAARKTDQKITLTLTIKKINIKLPQNLKVNFLGLIKYSQLIENLKKSEFLIFPSLRESFGLPLIEGVQANCNIIASDLNYVKELINPSYIFDPYDEKNISEVILLTLSNKKHPKSSIKVKNSIDSIFKNLINVQG